MIKKNTTLLMLAGLVLLMGAYSCKSSKKLHSHRKYLRETYNTLRDSLESKAEISYLKDSVKVLFPTNLLFGFDQYNINTEVLPLLRRLSNVLNKYDQTAILISGYTDSIGAAEYNNGLSGKRADAVKKELMRNHLKDQRISTWGMGARHPIATNQSEEGRSRNRRVEFIILYAE
jgi:outer membrane protein OmpA-like peptidoglycan-associated protein